MVPATPKAYQPMPTTPPDARQRIVDEIAHLESELDARLNGHPAKPAARPTPSSVVAAYRALLTAHYERLEKIDER